MIMITFAWLWMLPIFSPIIQQQQTQQQRSTHKNEEKRFGLVLRLHSHRPLIILQWSKCNSLASLIAGPGWNGSEYLSNWQKCHFWFGEMPLKLEKKEIMFHSGSPPQLVQLRCNLAYSDSWIIFCCHFWHSLFFHINFFSTCIWDCPKNWRQRKSHTQRESEERVSRGRSDTAFTRAQHPFGLQRWNKRDDETWRRVWRDSFRPHCCTRLQLFKHSVRLNMCVNKSIDLKSINIVSRDLNMCKLYVYMLTGPDRPLFLLYRSPECIGIKAPWVPSPHELTNTQNTPEALRTIRLNCHAKQSRQQWNNLQLDK